MENLFETKVYYASLGQKLEVGNIVQWNTSGHTMIGRILNFENDKAFIQTCGCRYKTNEELEEIKRKAKRQYKVAPHRLFLCTPVSKIK